MNPCQGCPKWNNLVWGLKLSDPSPELHTTPVRHIYGSLLHPSFQSPEAASPMIFLHNMSDCTLQLCLGQKMGLFLGEAHIPDPHTAPTQEETFVSSRMILEKPIYLPGSSVSSPQSRWLELLVPKPAVSHVSWHAPSQNINAWISQLSTGR